MAFDEHLHPRGADRRNLGRFAAKEKPAPTPAAAAALRAASAGEPPRIDRGADLGAHRPFFVYGTLRRRFGNSRLFPDSATFTPAHLPGAVLHGSGIPFCTEGDGTVVGELVEMPEDDFRRVLPQVDRLEGFHGRGERNMYDRAVARVEVGGRTVEAYVYVVDEPMGPRIPDDDYAAPRRR